MKLQSTYVLTFFVMVLALSVPSCADSDGSFCTSRGYIAYELRNGITPGVAGHVLKVVRFEPKRGIYSAGDVTLYRKSAGLAPGLHHVGFEVWDEADLRRSIGALAGKGVEVEREIDHPARHSIMIRDPDGLRLQFFVNRQWEPSVIAKAGQDESLYLL